MTPIHVFLWMYHVELEFSYLENASSSMDKKEAVN
jgi:hypothetical protein